MNRNIGFILMVLSLPCLGLAESLNLSLEGTLERASELSQQVQIAKAGHETAAARKGLEKAPFKAQLSVGTGIAGTYGFPLSIEGAAPSLFNVNYIQTLTIVISVNKQMPLHFWKRALKLKCNPYNRKQH
jgi:hypothetical protein